jgi:DNA-binding CsgD family transcriptional regulator
MPIFQIRAKDFDSFTKRYCSLWKPQTLAAARCCLVDGKTTAEVAEQFSLTKNHVLTLRARFVRLYANPPVKVVAAAFMQTAAPEGLPGLQPLRKEIRRLVSAGYSEQQIADYVRQNKVKVKATVLRQFVRGLQTARKRDQQSRETARAVRQIQ